MSLFISPNNEYPRYIGDIQLENPEYKINDKLPNGWKLVQDKNIPDVTGDNIVDEQFPILDESGNYVRNFTVRLMTDDEIAANNASKLLREKIDTLGLSDAELAQIRLGLI